MRIVVETGEGNGRTKIPKIEILIEVLDSKLQCRRMDNRNRRRVLFLLPLIRGT